MKKELLELARKKGVDVMECAVDNWVCYVSLEGNKVKHIKTTAKLSTLIKFLAKNKIKIKN